MTTLTGKQIANTYKQLLQVGSGNIGLTTTLQDVQDGDSNNSALQLSNSTVNINGLFGLNGVILTVGASTLNALTSSVVNITTGNDTVLFTQAGVSVSTASTSLTAVVNPTLSITNLYASTGIFLAGSAIPSTGDVAAVSALTSVNKAAITSINAGPASTFDALTVKTSITVGPDTGGNKAININSSDGVASLEIGGATATFVDLKTPFSDDYDLRIATPRSGGAAGGYIETASGGTFEVRGPGPETLATFTDDGSVALYHNNVKKLETAADGVDVDDINLNGKVLTITGDTDDTFKITAGANGATTLETVDTAGAAADLTLDVDGVIKLDGGNGFGSTFFQNNGTLYGSIFNSGNDFILRNKIVNGDISFQSQGGSVTALTLDMSAAGKAIFNKGAEFKDNVGIGTATPTELLHVKSTGDAVLLLEADSDNSGEDDNASIILKQDGGLSKARVGFADNTNTLEFYNELTPSTDSHIRFGTANTERMTILQTGNVGIGNTSPTSTLHVTGDATVDDINLNGKVLTITGDTDDTFKITAGTNGATTLQTVDTAGNDANLTIDADGSIRLDSGSTYGTVQIAHDGTVYGDIHKSGNDLKIRNSISDGDFIIQGIDGGSFFNALIFDMSEAGKAHFNAGAAFANDVTVEDINLSGKVLTITGDTGDTFSITTGAAGATTLATTDAAGTDGDLILDADGEIKLDSAGSEGKIRLDNAGAHYGQFLNSSDHFYVRSTRSDGNLIIQGNDGGSYINALTFDMSEAGAATFNNRVTAAALTVDNIDLNTEIITITGGGSRTASGQTENLIITNSNSTGDDTGIHMTAGNTGKSTIRFGAPGDDTLAQIFAQNDTTTATLKFAAGNSNTNLVLSGPSGSETAEFTGKVGIGTASPTEMLHLASTGDAIIKLEADTDNADETHNPKIMFSQDGGGATARVGYASGLNMFEMFNEYGDALRFGTNNTERMRIKNAGNVGINETDPLKKLHVNGPALSTVQTLTDASTVTSDFDVGQNFTLTLAGNRTLGAPSNVDAGQVGSIFIIQDGTGSRTLAYNSIWKFAGGTAPTLSTAAGAIDRLDYIVQSGTAIQAVLTKAYA